MSFVPSIVLLSDFGLSDPYAGIVKGVIKNISPKTHIIDLTHQIQPQNIKQAGFILANSFEYFPEHCIFMSVVDPGVGTERKIVLIKSENRYFLAPDNGLLSYTLQKIKDPEIFFVVNTDLFLPKVSATFQARDIFAPTAARLSLGAPVKDFGPATIEDSLITIPALQTTKIFENAYKVETIFKDVFGNFVTSATAEFINGLTDDKSKLKFKIGKVLIKGLSRSYADVEPGEPLAYIGSYGYLEFGVRNGSFHRYCSNELMEVIITVE